ncbi:MAG: hypothetical protein K8W52_26115 [Deltaproteobacteria bacterium]|nr:hypothetical protein [Deltaproteobacteria bacterium]
MVANPTCGVCGTTLRWFPEQHGWGCDRCRTIVPAAPMPPQAQAMPPQQAWVPATGVAPARRGKALYLGLGVGAVAIAGIAIAVAVGGGGGGGAASKDEVVRAAIAATVAGDVDRLIELGGVDAMLGAVSCSGDTGGKGYGGMPDAEAFRRELRDEMREAIKRAKKLPALEVIQIEDRDDPKVVVHEGKEVMDGCVGKLDVTEYRLKVTVRATVDGKPHDSTVKMKVLDIGGRWTLSDAPDLGDVTTGGAVDDAIETFRGFRDQMCACKDEACASRVNEAMTAWSTRMAASMKDVKPPEAQLKKMMTLAEELASCMTKAMSPP